MPHRFFFSYARANANDSYLKQFFDDLSDRIRGQLGLDKDEPVGFFDQPELKLGADWEAELNDALQTCPVMVSVYSPAYFNSSYCGKEWEVFRRRQELYRSNARASGEDVNRPPVIKPVIWIPQLPGQDVPEAVGQFQYYMGDPDADHNKYGLQTMRRRNNRYEDSYDYFIENLKNEILAAQRFNLPPLPDFTDLDQIDSAFHPLANVQPQPPAGAKLRRGPQFVRFVFIAGEPNEFPAEREQEFYRNYGGREWKPYYPDAPHPIMLVAQGTAHALKMFSDELGFSQTLATEVRNAEDEGSLVVIFVDCWTAELPKYQPVLQEIDRNNYFNCSIFIPVNDNDKQTFARRDALLEFVRTSIFKRWSLFANASLPLFRDCILTIHQLEDELKRTLGQLQTQVGIGLMDRATKDTIPRRIDTEITRPIMSHQST